jgi:hypothetical protein
MVLDCEKKSRTILEKAFFLFVAFFGFNVENKKKALLRGECLFFK